MHITLQTTSRDFSKTALRTTEYLQQLTVNLFLTVAEPGSNTLPKKSLVASYELVKT
jgi:hypothetical protein